MRRTLKKTVAVGLAAATAFSLCACGGSGDGSKSGSKDSLEVVIWDNNQQKGLQQICDLFTEETGIKVDVQVKEWDSYWTLLEAGASGGDMPDVFWMHSNNSQMYMKNNKLLKLDDYIEKSDKVDMSNYMSEITELYTYDGSYYAVPKDYDTIALWYNKKMFDDAGLEYPNENWTWDDLYEAAKKLTTGDKYGFCMNTSNDQDTYYNMVYSMGGYIVNDDHTKSGYDDANTIKAMDYVGKLLKDCCPPATTMSAYNNTSDKWVNCTDKFNLNAYLDITKDSTVSGVTNELVLRPYTYNSTVWSQAAQTFFADAWADPSKMEQSCKDFAVQMNQYIDEEDK